MALTRLYTALLSLAVLLASPALTFAADNPVPTAEELQRLIVRDTRIGTGDEAKSGDLVDVQYTGWLYDPRAPDLHGRQFDSSVGRGPFSFAIDGGSVIIGWDRGVAGMKVGGKRTLIIPPNLGYGERGAGRDIPPGAILVFDIELLKVE